MSITNRLSRHIGTRMLVMCLALTVFSPCKGMSTDTLALDKAKDSISVTGKMPYEAVEDSVAKIMSAVDSANLSRTIIEDSLAKRHARRNATGAHGALAQNVQCGWR